MRCCAGHAPILVACLSALFSHTPVTSYTILILPIAVQEIVLVAWLIFRGFSPSAGQDSHRVSASREP